MLIVRENRQLFPGLNCKAGGILHRFTDKKGIGNSLPIPSHSPLHLSRIEQTQTDRQTDRQAGRQAGRSDRQTTCHTAALRHKQR